MAQTNQIETAKIIEVSDTETIDKIKERLGGKELSNELIKHILDAKHKIKSSREGVQTAYRYAIEVEKLSKEESKTIVAELMGISLRTTESYIPEDLKDPKYISNKVKQLQESRKTLKTPDENATPGTYNEEGKYGTAQELQAQETKEPTEAPEQTLKRISKKFKQDVEITVAGRTFTIECTADPIERTITGKYNEKELFRILKGKSAN